MRRFIKIDAYAALLSWVEIDAPVELDARIVWQTLGRTGIPFLGGRSVFVRCDAYWPISQVMVAIDR